MGKYLERKRLNVPEDVNLPNTSIAMPHVIVGDEAFPLKTYLLRPYPRPQLNDPIKQNFNYPLSRARRVSENAFGILTQKFRIFQGRIQLTPKHADKIVLTTCILHNFIISSQNSTSITEPFITNVRNQSYEEGGSSVSAFDVRDII